MNKLHKISYLFVIILVLSGSKVFAQKGSFDVGGSLIYGSGAASTSSSLNNNLGIKLDANYAITDHIRLAADFGFFFPKKVSGSKFTVKEYNLNGHYLFVRNKSFDFYGLAGVNIISFKAKNGNFSASDSETGLNLGIGSEFGIGFGNIFGELKYAGIGGKADEIVLGAGLRFKI